ncbi:carbohydrate kinase family protein [Commensalibacter oyaizuii]|uniref:Sugar kinase n=1 Tax=Commensalibacter oyaizuii TaxID=3043873 RepID=A0ABT6Q2H6_9PROT|nr:sugar kinase [Commensalibacter sp. TBRC 16381]MDI2091225.1 sugar kinase [Commensalibacter sp. TBRC 16381]
MARFDVTSIGLCVVDLLGRVVHRIPEGGKLELIDEIRMTVAGTAGATAMDCGILGLSAQAVITVGQDDMGDYICSKLSSFGVDCSLVKRTDKTQTASTILPINAKGERPALHVLGASAVFTIDDKDMDAVLDANIIHVGGTGLLKAFDGEPTVQLLKKAKALGRTTTFDLIGASAQTFTVVEPCLPYIDYFIPSIEEASEMSGLTDPKQVAQFYKERGVKNAVLTMGGDGVYVSPQMGDDFTLPAFDISVVDTTGCGDSFSAGIIVGLTKGWDLKKSALFASAVAAKVAMGLGSDGKLVSFEDTIEAMNTLNFKK